VNIWTDKPRRKSVTEIRYKVVENWPTGTAGRLPTSRGDFLASMIVGVEPAFATA